MTYTVKEYKTNGEFTGSHEADAVPVLLNVTVPDQQHVRVEYSYRVTGYTPKTDTSSGARR